VPFTVALAKSGSRDFNVNLSYINRGINLRSGICPESIALLQKQQFTVDVMRILRNMKAARQLEKVGLIVASITITVVYVEGLLKSIPPEHATGALQQNRPTAQLLEVENEMSQVQATYKDTESNYGSALPIQMVANGYLTKLLANAVVRSYIE
jgi:hypothetical protein